MKCPPLNLCVCCVLLVAVLLGAGCTSAPASSATPVPTEITPLPTQEIVTTPEQSSCGLTTCHGLDLACGTNPPEVCTQEYRLGDLCRKYARCDSISGNCALVTTPQFLTCKACVERCQIGAGPDTLAAADCESRC